MPAFAPLLVAFSLAVASAGRPTPAKFPLDGTRLLLPNPVVFQPRTARLDAKAGPALAHVYAWLVERPELTLVRIEGHVDKKLAKKKGIDALQLSSDRALAVARSLVVRGVDCRRLLAVGMGTRRAATAKGPAERKAGAERIEVHAVSQNGKQLGAGPADGGGQPAGDPCH